MLGFGGARCRRRRVFQSIETLRFWNRRRRECLTTIKYVGNLHGFGLSDRDFASSRRRDVCRSPDWARAGGGDIGIFVPSMMASTPRTEIFE